MSLYAKSYLCYAVTRSRHGSMIIKVDDIKTENDIMLYKGDCLIEMDKIPSGSVDMV